MTKGLLIYGEIFAHFLIYYEALPHKWLLHSESPYEENLILSVYPPLMRCRGCREQDKGLTSLKKFPNYPCLSLWVNQLLDAEGVRWLTIEECVEVYSNTSQLTKIIRMEFWVISWGTLEESRGVRVNLLIWEREFRDKLYAHNGLNLFPHKTTIRAHTKRQAIQHGYLPSLLGDGDKWIEIVHGWGKKYFVLGRLE